jgi:hypothetical protein
VRAALCLLLFAGCSTEEGDACRGKPAACVAVTVLGSQLLDEIDVTATLPGGKQLTGRAADLMPPTFVPPVQFALLLPADTVGIVEVALIGSLRNDPIASGRGQAAVPPSGRGSVTVRLGAFSGDLAIGQPALDLGSDMNASVDMLPADPTLTPGVYSFPPTLVGRSSPITLTFSNPRPSDALISAIDVVPAGPPFAVDIGSSCAPGQAVAPGQSCTVLVNFAPQQRGRVSVEVRVSYGASGEASAFLDGQGVAWLAEGLEQDAGAVPTFYALWGTSLDDIWTGGDHSTLYHQTQNGWAKVAPPASATTVSSLWGTRINDLWLASSVSKELNHTQSGASWTPTTLAATGNVLTLWGQNDLYAASSAGEIWHYSGSNWNSERSADNSTLYALWGSDDSNVWAVGAGGKILHRTGTWSALPASPGDHYAVWGGAADDLWIAGCDLMGANCGFLKHLQGGVVSTATPKTGPLYGLWGSSQKDIFAVGKGGAILHYDGSTWSSEASSTNAELRAVWGSGGEVFAVGAGGTILHRY